MKTIETPSSGRARIIEGFDQITIIIPAKKGWKSIAPLLAIPMIFLVIRPHFKELFTSGSSVFNLFFWAVFGASIISMLGQMFWSFFGKEVIECSNAVLTIKKKGNLLARTKTYDLNEAKLFRAEERFEYGRDADIRKNPDGTICFEYGTDTIRFGDNLSEAEASYVLERMKKCKVLNSKHF